MELENKEKQYTTEQRCRKYIASIKWKDGFVCPECNYHDAWITGEYKYKCKKCGHKTSVTAGTIFQDSHIPLPVWFKGIEYISSETANITVREFQQVLGVNSMQTAHSILSKIKKTLRYPYLNKLNGTVELFKVETRINNKICYAILGAENKNSRIGRIRLHPIRRGLTDDATEFIKDCIEPNSTLICKEYWSNSLRLPGEYKVLSREDILRQNKELETNGEKDKQFRYLRIDRLKNKLRLNQSGTDISAILNKICINENLFKEKIPFDKLMELAVNTKSNVTKNTKLQ